MGFEHVTLAVRHLMRALAHLYFYLRQMVHVPRLSFPKGNEKGRQTDRRVARVPVSWRSCPFTTPTPQVWVGPAGATSDGTGQE